MMFKSFIEVALGAFRREADDPSQISQREKIDGRLTDNMRALRLTTTMIDWLVSLGVPASDVTHAALGVTTTYCSRRVHIDIVDTIILVSQDRGDDREPLTINQSVAPRGTDYRKIQLLQDLSDSIQLGELSLYDAERQLDKIINKGRLYPRWVTHLAYGALSAGVMVMYSHDPVVWIAAFIMGGLVSLMLYRLAKMGLPSFYSQAAAGFLIVMIATVASLLATNGIISLFGQRDPTSIVVGGIVLLVAGMMITSAFQDAIDEYYITAGSRLLKVVMMTSGIVLGATVGLYFATKLGVTLAATPDRLSISAANYQYIGAALIAAAFALGNQARWIGVFSAGVAGALSLYGVLLMASLGLGVIPASGIAAALVGLSATVLTHWFRVPTITILNAGIIPLVPGLTLYSALTHIAQAVPSSAEFDYGIALLMRAVLIAAVVAAGATVGNIIGRPARRRLVYLQNRLPRYRLSRKHRYR